MEGLSFAYFDIGTGVLIDGNALCFHRLNSNLSRSAANLRSHSRCCDGGRTSTDCRYQAFLIHRQYVGIGGRPLDRRQIRDIVGVVESSVIHIRCSHLNPQLSRTSAFHLRFGFRINGSIIRFVCGRLIDTDPRQLCQIRFYTIVGSQTTRKGGIHLCCRFALLFSPNNGTRTMVGAIHTGQITRCVCHRGNRKDLLIAYRPIEAMIGGIRHRISDHHIFEVLEEYALFLIYPFALTCTAISHRLNVRARLHDLQFAGCFVISFVRSNRDGECVCIT